MTPVAESEDPKIAGLKDRGINRDKSLFANLDANPNYEVG